MDTEPFKEDPDFSTYSESFNGSELEPDHDVHETIYTGNDNIKWGSTALSPAMYRQHNIIHVRARLAGWVTGFEDQWDLFLTFFTAHMVIYICECTNQRLLDDLLEITNDELLGCVKVWLIAGITE